MGLSTRAKALYEWFINLPFIQRFIVTSIISSFIGASVLSIVSKYALYFYAYENNFRIPAEGTEYVHLFVGLLSLSLFLVSIIVLLVIYYALQVFSNIATKIKLHKVVLPKRGPNSLNGLIRSYLFMVIFIGAFVIIPHPDPQYAMGTGTRIFFGASLILALLFLLTMMSVQYFFKDSARKVIALTVSLIAVTLVTGSLFYGNNYKSLLLNMKFGGELPVTIEYRKADNTASELKGKLLIRTSKYFIINKDNSVFEIPSDRISLIQLHAIK